MKDVNCKNWSHKFSFGRGGSQQSCSEGTAGFQFRVNPGGGKGAPLPSTQRPEAEALSREVWGGEGFAA